MLFKAGEDVGVSGAADEDEHDQRMTDAYRSNVSPNSLTDLEDMAAALDG